MLTRQGRLCWCVVFPAAPGRCEWCGQGREILKAGQAQSLWGRLGQVFKESLFSSHLRALGYTLLFCSQFSNYCELTNSLPFFFFFPGCSAWFARTWFPNQGLNPGPQQWEHWVLTTGLPGNSPSLLLKINLHFGKKHSFSCSRLIGIIVVRTTLITHWAVHHRFTRHLMERSQWAHMIITVRVPSPPFSQEGTRTFREVNCLSQGHTACTWWRQPGSGKVVESTVSKLFLTAFNLGRSHLKQTAFPEKTDIWDYRKFRKR